jgi:hypothetical protein
MEHKDLPNVLAAHADQLNRSAESDTHDFQVPPEQGEELRSLLQLAEQIKGALDPVTPSPAYKRRLGLELAEMAQRRRSSDLLVAPPAPRREWIVAVALAGGIAYLVRTRMQGRSQGVGQVQT